MGMENSAQKVAVFYLKSKRGHFANPGRDASLQTTPMAARRTRANAGQLLNPAAFSSARARRTPDRSRTRRQSFVSLPLASQSRAGTNHHYRARPGGVKRFAIHARRNRKGPGCGDER